jgi:hypothetical protein
MIVARHSRRSVRPTFDPEAVPRSGSTRLESDGAASTGTPRRRRRDLGQTFGSAYPRWRRSSARTSATGPEMVQLSGLIPERTVWTAQPTMSSQKTLISRPSGSRRIAVHLTPLDADLELAQLASHPRCRYSGLRACFLLPLDRGIHSDFAVANGFISRPRY